MSLEYEPSSEPLHMNSSVLSQTGSPSEAIEHFAKALEIRRTALGPDHAQTIAASKWLAK